MTDLVLKEAPGYLEFTLGPVRYGSENEIGTGGIDFGPHVYVLETEGDYSIVKVPGHRTWESIGSQTYCETYYYLMHTVEREGRLWGKMLYEITPGFRWMKALALLREKMKELAKGS
jgi:hypothetical protein